MNKRKFLKKSFYGAIGVGVLSGLYAWQIEPFWLEFVKVKMPIYNLPSNLKGKTLMQISDIHVGKRFDWNYIIDSFKEAQKLTPDYVVYTGEYVSYDKNNNFEDLKKVFENPVKGKLGTIGILGNHDYGKYCAEPDVANSIVEVLQDRGVSILRNEQVNIKGLNIIGFDDYWGTNFNSEKALEKFKPEDPNIVLCNNPDVCDLGIWKDYKGWILAGHTHGGQVKPPFLPPPMLPVKNKRYSSGEIDLGDGKTLYINRALGHLWQIRLNVRPEITVFELC
ncbi:metallophosphoesterase [Flavobacteriales bacterium]|nr:metallophosphoesterase [Flavobacteriales bacterium]